MTSNPYQNAGYLLPDGVEFTPGKHDPQVRYRLDDYVSMQANYNPWSHLSVSGAEAVVGEGTISAVTTKEPEQTEVKSNDGWTDADRHSTFQTEIMDRLESPPEVNSRK